MIQGAQLSHPPRADSLGESLPPQLRKTCDELAEALDEGGIGKIVAKHEQLILHYYADVQAQARQSFITARIAALVGFAVLIGTVMYALRVDWLTRLDPGRLSGGASSMVSYVGLLGGALIEFIAAVAFWLYSRGARQFSAFHICLERTHRYLLAYKIADEIAGERDETLKKLVCIMANAPMITHSDSNAAPRKRRVS